MTYPYDTYMIFICFTLEATTAAEFQVGRNDEIMSTRDSESGTEQTLSTETWLGSCRLFSLTLTLFTPMTNMFDFPILFEIKCTTL